MWGYAELPASYPMRRSLTGMWGDLVIFNPDTITDVATFEKPNQLSVGMQYVLVNSVPVIEHGKMTNALPGKVVRGPAWKP